MHARIAALVLILATALVGCAGRAWRQARAEDTVAAYHRFLQEHGDSSFGARARARLELTRIREKPSRKAFEKFVAQHGESFPDLVEELRPQIAETFFRHARAVGTVEAYRAFLEEFGQSSYAARAQGNAEFLESGGFARDVDALADFAKRHPESDYAAEAERSVASVAMRSASAFRRVGLVVRIDPSTPGADRLDRVFRERAFAAYAAAGLELVQVSSADQARSANLPAVLFIDHQEREVGTKLEAGQVTEPSIVAETVVTLKETGQSEPIWSDSFEYRVPLSARRESVSVLFGPGSQASYWAEFDGVFFVPVARWNTRVAARAPQAFEKPAVALEVAGSRAVVLFGDGDFQLYELSDPARPLLLGEYRRPRDLATFDGVRVSGARVALYGPDGVEIVRMDDGGGTREAVYGREKVGSVVGLEAVGDAWIAASNRGLLRLGGESEAVRTLVPRQILGLDRAGDRLLFSDGESLYVATPRVLQAGRIEGQLRLGRGFRPEGIRVYGASALVLGRKDVVWVDLRRPRQPRVLSRIGGQEAGRIRDAAVVGGRIFLLGPRGLQVADGRGERVVDSVDVAARERLDATGRHLVMIGGKALQVVDATPFVAPAPAAPHR